MLLKTTAPGNDDDLPVSIKVRDPGGSWSNEVRRQIKKREPVRGDGASGKLVQAIEFPAGQRRGSDSRPAG